MKVRISDENLCGPTPIRGGRNVIRVRVEDLGLHTMVACFHYGQGAVLTKTQCLRIVRGLARKIKEVIK